MAHEPLDLEVDRPLTSSERQLVRWLLEHGHVDNSVYLEQLEHARVWRRCACGCASIDFSVGGVVPQARAMEVRSDYSWRSETGHFNGAFVFAQDGLLAGLDLWSIDGGETPATLPAIEALVPFGSPQA